MNEQIAAIYGAARTFEDYRSGLRVHAAAFSKVYDRLQFVPDMAAEVAPLGDSRLLVLTEDFCVDSALSLPLIARLVEASPRAELRIASRNSHRQLANQFPGRGGVSRLPTVLFLDRNDNVEGYWSERSSQDQLWMNAFLVHDPMPEMIVRDGLPAPVLAAWMERRLTAQLPFFEAMGWRFVRDELVAVSKAVGRGSGVARSAFE